MTTKVMVTILSLFADIERNYINLLGSFIDSEKIFLLFTLKEYISYSYKRNRILLPIKNKTH